MLKPTSTTYKSFIPTKPKSFNGDEPPKKRHKLNFNAFKDEDDEMNNSTKYATLHNALMATVAVSTDFGKKFQPQSNPIKSINNNPPNYLYRTQMPIMTPMQTNIKPIPANMDVQHAYSDISNSPVSTFVSDHSNNSNNSNNCNYNPTFDKKAMRMSAYNNNKNNAIYNNNIDYNPMKTCCCDCCNVPNNYKNIKNNQQNQNVYSQINDNYNMNYPINSADSFYESNTNNVFI